MSVPPSPTISHPLSAHSRLEDQLEAHGARQARVIDALADRYTVLRELGHGGMATVYLADDLRHGRQVAVKVLRPELGALLGPDRFTREIRIAAALNHPHILPLYDSGEAGGRLFYVMPYVRGGSLRQRLATEGQLATDEAVALVRQVAAALDHAHAHGLIHRDIKPENILLHEGEAMVTDFGIALAAGTAPGDRLTQAGLMVGTPEYMSPEQAAGERTLDGRSDVYSLGCVLYELLTGEPPHAAATARAVIARRFSEPAPRVRRARPAVPAAVDEAITRALAPDPADRFPSTAAFADALAAGPAPARAPRLPSIAVLPFDNLSADPENEFFADGITEDVIAQLSKIRSLKVISRSSVMRFKKREQSLREIGVALDVTTLLEGSVRRAGSRVRIVGAAHRRGDGPASLGGDLRPRADRHLRHPDRRRAADRGRARGGALAGGADPDPEGAHRRRRGLPAVPAGEALPDAGGPMKASSKGSSTSSRRSRAIRTMRWRTPPSPTPTPRLGLGVAGALSPEEAFRRAKAAVEAGARDRPGLAEAHAMLAFLRFVCDYDWAGAEAEFKRAIELNPNSGDAYDSYGLMLSALERYDEAIEMQRRAHELDPLAHRMDIVTTLLRAGRYDEALRRVTQGPRDRSAPRRWRTRPSDGPTC